MKKLILTLAMVMTVLMASATSVRYFTRSQAMRVASTLDAQNELMIYCGYEYELATYVIVNEVWTERVNSKYYEIWLYGYDAYTGEEIYMPIDLACIWLYNAYGNRMYSAAQYLRFRSTVATPNFYWTMPPYNPFTRHFHDPHFNHGYTYHFEIHRYGWRPPEPPHGGPWLYHPYYMRTPHTPAPVPTKPFTPGVNYPQTPDGHGYIGGGSRTTLGTRSTGFNNAGGTRSGNNMNNAGNPGTTSRNSVSTNTGSSNSRNSGTVNTGTSNSRNSGTVNTGSNNSRNSGTVNTGSSNSRNSGTVNTGSNNSRNSGTENTGSSNSRNSGTVNTGSNNSRNSGTVNTGSNSSRSGSTTNTGSSNSRNSGTVNTGSNNSRSGSTANTGSSNSRNSGTVNTGSNNSRSGSTTNTGSSNSRSGSNTNTGSTNSRNTNSTTNTGSRSTR